MNEHEALYNQADEDRAAGNDERAFATFSMLAEAGHADAMLQLALMYSTGSGIRFDMATAIEWERRAAEAGSKIALLNLGISYRHIGEIVLARETFEKAAALGDDEACLELAKLFSVSTRETDTVLRYLRRVIASDGVTEASQEDAEYLLRVVSGGL